MIDEDGKGEGELIIYRTDDGTDEMQLRLVDGSVWLAQAEIGTLFADEELSEAAVVKQSLTTAAGVSHTRMEQIAHERYETFEDKRRVVETEAAEREAIAELEQIEAQAKRLPKPASPRKKGGKKAS